MEFLMMDTRHGLRLVPSSSSILLHALLDKPHNRCPRFAHILSQSQLTASCVESSESQLTPYSWMALAMTPSCGLIITISIFVL
jgi:hypothetical protein